MLLQELQGNLEVTVMSGDYAIHNSQDMVTT